MDLSNNDQMKTILETGAPGLWELKELLDKYEVDVDSLQNFVIELGRAKQSATTTKVTMLVSDKKIKGIFADNSELSKGDNMFYSAIVNAGLDTVNLMRGLYLLANIKRFTKWGKVVFLMQDGVVVRVDQEQGYKVS